MNTNKIFLLACLMLAPMTTAYAQEDDGYDQESDFTLHRYSPQWVDSEALVDTMLSLYGRVLEFEDRSVENLTMLDDSIVIYESEERMTRILNAIATLDSDSSEERFEDETISYNMEDMVIKSYHPINMESVPFFQLASELYGGDILVGHDWHSKLRYAQGRGIIVFEVEGEAQDLLKKLEDLDNTQSVAPESGLVMMEYMPRFVSPEGLMEGVRSFQANVFDPYRNHQNGGMNIAIMYERGMIVVRDHQERAMEIMQALKHLDQPLPQTMLVCQVIQGSNDEPQGDAVRASQEIEQQLKQVLPHKYYTVSGSGMLRTGVAAGTKLELFMDKADSGAQWKYQLEMQIGSFDTEQGSLSLNACQLSLDSTAGQGSRDLFRTSTTIYSGEYAVLGVTGADPLFLVVQLVPIKAH